MRGKIEAPGSGEVNRRYWILIILGHLIFYVLVTIRNKMVWFTKRIPSILTRFAKEQTNLRIDHSVTLCP